MSTDKRFAKFGTDPKFRSVPKKNRKVKIDSRFQGLFNDKKFNNKVGVDKRGRPQTFSTLDNYKKYYDVEEDDEEEEEEEESSSTAATTSKKSQIIQNRLLNGDIDYARGEGVLLSDSSSEEESSDQEGEDEEEEARKIGDSGDDDDGNAEDEGFDKWGELDHDAERTTTDESITQRLALCNMDWDRVGAKDIYVAMNSFCPTGGSVETVHVYTSEFGKKRLEEEERLGPQELRRREEDSGSDDDDEEDIDQDEIEKKAMERVRRYQVNRLKYYYAVVKFDSKESANAVYTECDGMEFELSASRFDLRFIPDDMDFENDNPKEVCKSMPTKYKPKEFVTTALQQGKVELTWDETDPERLKAMQRAFEVAEDDDDEGADYKAYLASDNDEEDEEGGRQIAFGSGSEDEDDERNAVDKYKALLAEISGKSKDDEKDYKKDDKNEEGGNMEMTWKTSEEETKESNNQKLTPWEQYLDKKKKKRKEKKEKAKKANEELNEEKEEDEVESKAFSDDELPDGFDDPFFQEKSKPVKNPKGKKKKGKTSKNEDDNEEDNKDLALMVMDSDDDKKHFDYKDILKNESKKSKKKKRKAKEAAEDNFELDLNDDRFGAIYKNADYNVDPSHPNFKKTKSMQMIISEKQKRIQNKIQEEDSSPQPPPSKKSKKSKELENLVKSVKMKTKQSSSLNKKIKNK